MLIFFKQQYLVDVLRLEYAKLLPSLVVFMVTYTSFGLSSCYGQTHAKSTYYWLCQIVKLWIVALTFIASWLNEVFYYYKCEFYAVVKWDVPHLYTILS